MTPQKDPEGSEKKQLHKLVDFKDRRVLEIGCGEGRLTWTYARETKHTVGTDLDSDSLRVATIDRPSDLQDVVFFHRATSLSLPYSRESFEIAILAWSL